MSEQLGSGASGRQAAVGTNSPAGEPLASSSSFVGSARRLSAIRDALGDGALRLAYHAAVPVVVDADLLNLLRVNFFLDDPPDVLPFEVEAELLLSPLFREIGEGLYEIDPGLRNLLLSGLHTRYGHERIRRVAALLEQYTDAAAAWRSLPDLELAQQLTALSFLDPAGAERWLDVHEASAARPSSSSASSSDDGPGGEWYVAMRRRVAENSDITTIDTEIPGYLGRVLDGDGTPVGTCFQVVPDVLVTAWHVLDYIGAAAVDARVRIDPLAGGEAFDAVVARTDRLRDLAVLTSAGGLPTVAGPLTATDQIPLRVKVTVVGYAVPDNPGHLYGFLDAPGEWAGGTTRDDAVPLGRMTSYAVVPGMSGAPVIRDSDGAVAGIVSGRYNGADGWLPGTVWVARAEDLAVLLNGIAEVAGWPLAEVRDPFVLEVHRPVQPEDAPPGLPVLPPYVPREHDEMLGSVVRAAVDGRSGIAVLVGEPSTGKTRACWEALALLRDQDPPWRLWHPIDSSRLDAALRELPGIGPRTVVWLDEAQLYLDPVDAELGEPVAAGLRELLHDPGRAPVLVLATMWPQFWDALTARPAESEDRHAQARELLAGHDITVPAAFTAAQMVVTELQHPKGDDSHASERDNQTMRSAGKLLLVDDSVGWIDAICEVLLEYQVDSAQTFQEALTLIEQESAYDLAIVSLNLTDSSQDMLGATILNLLHERYPATRLIATASSPPTGTVTGASRWLDRYGVDDLLIKSNQSIPDLQRAVQEALQRGKLSAQFGGSAYLPEALTQREREVAALVASGRSNKAIADELVISPATAARHVANILAKLGFSSRAQIAAWAADRQLDPDSPDGGSRVSTRGSGDQDLKPEAPPTVQTGMPGSERAADAVAMIEIGVIDDDQMLLQGMTAWAASTGDIRLVALATSVEEYLGVARTPKIVILDLNLGNYTDPVRNVAQLVDSGLKVIVASDIPDRSYVAATTEAGAAAYIMKSNNLDTLANVIRSIHAGEVSTTPEHAFWLSRDDRPQRPHLSPRERQILIAVGNGMTRKAIARQLNISTNTVQTHLERVRQKYAVVGRPIEHPGHYSERLREDSLGRDGLPESRPDGYL